MTFSQTLNFRGDQIRVPEVVVSAERSPADQIPVDWNNQILRRVLFNPDSKTGRTDRFVLISMPRRPGWLTLMRS
jgi:hypothetical protein